MLQITYHWTWKVSLYECTACRPNTDFTVFRSSSSPKPTQPQQNRRNLSHRPTWWIQSVLGFRPAYPGSVQPGVNIVPAQRFGLGHQLLVCGRAVKHFSRKHRGAAQHLHAHVIRRGLRCTPPRLHSLAQRTLLSSTHTHLLPLSSAGRKTSGDYPA